MTTVRSATASFFELVLQWADIRVPALDAQYLLLGGVDADHSHHGGHLRRPSGFPGSLIAPGDGGVRLASLDRASSVDVKGHQGGWTVARLGEYTVFL